ncbi:MAG: methylmalonate-semialdehyde dehydrogenase (acylating) [Gammaproteobacteria bacterium RBG_16_66_13]|nr:MAG: methylmalonate-semialdehyde dehydrogenase (acylating) [Gammaproteobacteria bacterium RBG_16_66_13]
MTGGEPIPNYIEGAWRASQGTESMDVVNPATAEPLGRVPLSPAADVGAAVEAAQRAFPGWRNTPPAERVQHLFRLKNLMEADFTELARSITLECGKTLEESRAELRRAIENVEIACGIPLLMQGYNAEDIAAGIDETMIRQPVGVCAIICPFNFPGMIPFWFMPYALACGNPVIVKPSERVPLTMQRIFGLLEQAGIPAGVVNLVNGARQTVDAILDHPVVRAVSFVGSTAVARNVYARAAQNGKRAQCQGGAKNPVVVLPDADMEAATRIVADSAFGCAGQRCLAVSLAITVDEARQVFTEAMCDAAASRVVGYGLDESVQMGPVISAQSKARVESLIGEGEQEGGAIPVDGRRASIPGYERGFFVRPTILTDLPPRGDVARTEIFGPVLGMIHVNTLDEAVALVNQGAYGNQASLFTRSGDAARRFRHEAEAGNIGINIGVAAPMAFFPFSGWKESFFGDLHGQGLDAVEFFTQKKVVIERWPREWLRKF